MFMHLGGDIEIPIREVVAIFDIESTHFSEITQEFMMFSLEEDFIHKISQDTPKSFIITERESQCMIYLSPISSLTLQKRSDFFRGVENYYVRPNK